MNERGEVPDVAGGHGDEATAPPECFEEMAADHLAFEDLGSLYDYGLSFDYVEPNTFEDQPYGFWRYQLSWGGPSDEFRLGATRFLFTPRSG